MRMQLLGKAATIPYTTIDYALSLAQALRESDPRTEMVRALNQDLVVHFLQTAQSLKECMQQTLNELDAKRKAQSLNDNRLSTLPTRQTTM